MNTDKLNVAHKEEEYNIITHTLHQNKCDASLLIFTKSGNKNNKRSANGQIFLHRQRNQIHHKTLQRFPN
jgi:hypothetical protein